MFMSFKRDFLLHSSDLLNRNLNVNKCVSFDSNLKNNFLELYTSNFTFKIKFSLKVVEIDLTRRNVYVNKRHITKLLIIGVQLVVYHFIIDNYLVGSKL
jgi:hypothetical protein